MLHFLLLFTLLLLVLSLSSAKKLTGVGKKNTNITAYLLCMSFLCFLSAFRSSVVGNDTNSYLYIFQQVEDIFRYGSRYEKGYIYLNYLLSRITHNPQSILIVTSLFIYFSFSRFTWKHSAMPWLSVLLFFMLCFGSTVNVVRQFFAIAILLFGIEFTVKRKPILFFATILLASQFHNTAVFFAPVYFFPKITLNKTTVFVILGAGIIGYILFAPLLNYAFNYFSMYEYYTEGRYFEGETRIATVMQIALSLVVSLFSFRAYSFNKNISWRKSEDGQYIKVLIILQFVATALYIMCLRVNLFDRIAMYYSVFSFINIANAISMMPLNKRKFYCVLFVLSLLIYSSVIIIERPEWNRVYPYEFCWQETKHS